MTAQNYDACFKATLKHEGGYVNHPRDPGGATNFGVIQRVYTAYRKNKGLQVQSVRAISREEVAEIYRLQYWQKVNGDALPDGPDYVAYDAGVNSGPSRGVKWLQQALGIKADGNAGQVTINAALEAPDKKKVVRAACAIRTGFLRRLGHWSTFGRGWTRRVVGVEALAVQMVIKASRLGVAPEAQPPVLTADEEIRQDAEVEAGRANKVSKQDIGTAGGVAAGDAVATTQTDPAAAADGSVGSWLFIALVVTGALIVIYYLIRSRRNAVRAGVYGAISKGELT